MITYIYKHIIQYMVSRILVKSTLTCLLVFTLACTKAQDSFREPTIQQELRDSVLVETSIFTVLYSETKEQPIRLTYKSTDRPKNVDRGSMNFYTEDGYHTSDNKVNFSNNNFCIQAKKVPNWHEIIVKAYQRQNGMTYAKIQLQRTTEHLNFELEIEFQVWIGMQFGQNTHDCHRPRIRWLENQTFARRFHDFGHEWNNEHDFVGTSMIRF